MKITTTISIKTVKLICTLLGMVFCTACSDGVRQNNRGTKMTSDDVYVSQKPTKFEVDPSWPKNLPNHWVLGEVSGLAVDAEDHVWIVHRPNSLTDRETMAALDPPASECCIPAPSVIEFDSDGNVLQSWGGLDTTKQWFAQEHGIYIDGEDNVWIGGNNAKDQVVLKFSNNGQLLLQIGEWGITKGSNDTRHLGGPTDIAVDENANEVYISDGYGNRRVIVFDSKTGEYKRHWGAYGKIPEDIELPAYDPNKEPSRSFLRPVHAVRLSTDNLVYVADRNHSRIQVFQKDGTFVIEAFIARQTLGNGTTWDIEFSRDKNQTYMYVADGMNRKVWILDRLKLEVIGSFGHGGRNAGQFGWVHNVAMDSKGNLYTASVTPGRRVQKFRPLAD
jgi:DNA-binding beta-propeller fold protein YncE